MGVVGVSLGLAAVLVYGGRFEYALHAAAIWGNVLLDNGADVNAQGGTYGNALQVELLIGGNTLSKRISVSSSCSIVAARQ